MATLVGVLILAIAAAVVVPDFLAAIRSSSAVPANRNPDDAPPLIPGAVNDPRIQDLQATVDRLAILIGSTIGRGAGAGAGSAVAGAELGTARGLGSQTISDDEIQAIVTRTVAVAAAAGTASGTNTGLLGGTAVGSAIVGFPIGVVGGGVQSGAVGGDWLNRLLARYNVPRYDTDDRRWEDAYGNPL